MPDVKLNAKLISRQLIHDDLYHLSFALDNAAGKLLAINIDAHKVFLPTLPYTGSNEQCDVLCYAHNNRLKALVGHSSVAVEIHPLPQLEKKPTVLLADENGIAAALSLAKQLKNTQSIVFLSAQSNFPFRPQPSKYLMPELPGHIIAAAPLLDDWGIPSRLASQADIPGCFQGNALELGSMYLGKQKSPNFPAIWLAGSQKIINNGGQLLKNFNNVQVLITE